MSNSLYSKLAKSSKAIRKNVYPIFSLKTPISVSHDTIVVDGESKSRTRIVLMATPCKVATCSMCPYPDEGLNFKHKDEDLLIQISENLLPDTQRDILTLYHNGNFFLNSEISPDLRKQIYYMVQAKGFKSLCVESLPQTISEADLQIAKECMPDVQLEISMGVQSTTDFVRTYCVISPFKETHLRNALEAIRKFSYTPRVFLMFGQPFLTSSEALWDTLKSVEELDTKYGVRNPVICPLGVMKNTLAKDIELKTNWRAPSFAEVLWLMKVLKEKKLAAKIAINCNAQEYIEDIEKIGVDSATALFRAFNDFEELSDIVLNMAKELNERPVTEEQVILRALSYLDMDMKG